MKKVFTILSALVFGAMLASPAFAADAAEPMLISPAPEIAELTEMMIEKEAYPSLEGFDYTPVQTAVSNAAGSIDYIFDGSTKTMCGMDMTWLPYRTVSIYVTSVGPFTASAVAGVFSSTEEDISIQVTLYGTNDSLLLDWNKIELSSDVTNVNDYVVFTNADYAEGAKAPAEPETYQFYRIDLTLLEGNSFALAELVLYRPEGPIMIPVYDSSDGVEVGEEPIGYIEYNPSATRDDIVIEEEEPEVNLGSKPFVRRLFPIPTPYSPSK